MYLVKGHKSAYTFNQLQKVQDDETFPNIEVVISKTKHQKYVVEKIIKKFQKKGKTFYTVKYKGFNGSYDEPAENLTKELIDDFNKKMG